MISLFLSEIGAKIGAKLEGPDLVITELSTIDEPKPGTLSFVSSRKYLKKLAECPCAALIVPPGVSSPKHSLLIADDPYLAFARAMRLFHPVHFRPRPAIALSAQIAPDAELADDVYVGHHALIEEEVKIGPGSVIHAGVYIGSRAKIGSDCIIYPHAVIMHDVVLGDRVVIYPAAVIGSDGFGYARYDGKPLKIPQAGTVVIEDDVEVGAGTTIDRATLGETRIGTGTIIDNLVQIAHNCVIGPGCIICAQVGLAGSSRLGRNVTLAGQVGVAGHLTIGDDAVVEAQSGVPNNVPAGAKMFGYPARDIALAHRIEAILSHLPEYIERLRRLEAKCASGL